MTETELSPEAERIFKSAVDHFFITYLGLWKREDPRTAETTTAVAGILVASLLDVAARVAQDLGMTPDHLTRILTESYERALQNAPKWG